MNDARVKYPRGFLKPGLLFDFGALECVVGVELNDVNQA